MNRQSHDQIGYCDFTWGIVTECHGPNGTLCPYCYARPITQRWKNNYPYGFEPTYWPGRLDDPLTRRKSARIFVADMADLMGDWEWRDYEIPDRYHSSKDVIDWVISTMRLCPQHTFLTLTKNPGAYAEFEWPDNVELGTTITNQEDADIRIPLLYKAKARVKWLSIEPLQGEINLRLDPLHECTCRDGCRGRKGLGELWGCALEWGMKPDWLAIGALNGPGVPRTDRKHIDHLMDQCREHHVPYWLKSMELHGRHIKTFEELAGILGRRDFRRLPGMEV